MNIICHFIFIFLLNQSLLGIKGDTDFKRLYSSREINPAIMIFLDINFYNVIDSWLEEGGLLLLSEEILTWADEAYGAFTPSVINIA